MCISSRTLFDAISGYSFDNSIYYNNFISNGAHVSCIKNTWDNYYPSGGNYWSGYTDEDFKSGQNQDEPGADGIWDGQFFISANNEGNYIIDVNGLTGSLKAGKEELPWLIIIAVVTITIIILIITWRRIPPE